MQAENVDISADNGDACDGKKPEVILVMVRLNYKVYANILVTHRTTQNYAVVLNGGGTPTLIQKDMMPQEMWSKIRFSKGFNTHHVKN